MAVAAGTTKIHKRLTGLALARFIRMVERTSGVTVEPADMYERLSAAHPAIAAVWHGQFMMTYLLRPKGIKVSAMVARHGDAELIGEAMKHLDVELIRGAGAGGRKKDRGGVYALRASVAALESGSSLVMTADVPPGPARRAGLGILMIARLSGRPIIPVATATSRFKSFKTWSRLTINLPGSKLAVVAGDPITVPAGADDKTLEALRITLENELNRITARAYEIVGADIARATPPSAMLAMNIPHALPPPGLALKMYRGAMRLAAPAAELLLTMRERQGKEDPLRRPERIGRASIDRPSGPLVWVHAASVGETNAVAPLIEAMSEQAPGARFLLTTGTVTSAGLAAQRLRGRAIHQYVPLDIPAYAERFLDHWQPSLAVFTESEIWPNLILATAARDIPLALVNARMSGRSLKRWQRNRGMAEPLFSRFDVILAQNERLARGFELLGARRVLAVGNLKIDSPPPPIDAAELARLEAALAGRPRVVATSTHDGEETVVAEAHRMLAADFPGLCTIIAPRHPGRGAAISEALARTGLIVHRRSVNGLPGPGTDIYIADTIGELGTFYALAPIALIGGSLVPHGGQNPIEAVRRNAAVLVGPHAQNFKDEYRALLRKGGARQVNDAKELAEALATLLGDENAASAMRSRASEAIATLSGALERTVAALLPILPAEARLERVS